MNRPEHRLLLACASICGELQRRDRILACIAEGMDWDYLLRTAARHMVTSMLYRHLLATCADSVPSGIMAGLHEHYKKNSINSLLYTAELIKILDLFKSRGIQAIPFKGPVLAYSLYEEPELREFVDLDILLCGPDVFRALDLLTDSGYGSVPDFSRHIRARMLRNDFHYQVKKPDGRSIVELHWNLAPGYLGFELPVSLWMDRAESVTIQGRPVPNLACADHLTALSLHAYKHMWQSLVWIADIARLLVRYPDRFRGGMFDRPMHPDLEHILSVTLLLARDLLGAPLPDGMHQRIRVDGKCVSIAETIQGTLFQRETAGEALRLKRLQFGFISKRTDRFRAVLFFAFRPLKIDLNVGLPRFLYPLYFILRPVGLLSRFLHRLTTRS